METHRITIQHPSRLEREQCDGSHLLPISGQHPAFEVTPKFMKGLRLIAHRSLTRMCVRDQTQRDEEQHPGDMTATEILGHRRSGSPRSPDHQGITRGADNSNTIFSHPCADRIRPSTFPTPTSRRDTAGKSFPLAWPPRYGIPRRHCSRSRHPR